MMHPSYQETCCTTLYELQTDQQLLPLPAPRFSKTPITAILILSKSEIVFRMKNNFAPQLLRSQPVN
jgi:hypothetical protein